MSLFLAQQIAQPESNQITYEYMDISDGFRQMHYSGISKLCHYVSW